jgi:hypothetical protein
MKGLIEKEGKTHIRGMILTPGIKEICNSP